MFVYFFVSICVLAWLPYSTQECVYTRWNAWSDCHSPLQLESVSESLQIPESCVSLIEQRTRNRTLIFFSETDPPCPHLTETDLCQSDSLRSCLRDSWDHFATSLEPHYWRVDAWGECEQLIGQNATCGVGTQTRNVSCFDKDGNQSEPQLCPASEPVSYRICHFSCPCEMFPWSHWSPCLAPSCDHPSGERSRFRSVARQPTYGSCTSLWQREECTENVTCQSAAYKWNVGSDWSECSDGLSTRLVLCYRQTETQDYLSDSSNCENISRPLSHLYCGSGAVLSEWGDWGRCGEGCPSLQKRIRVLISGTDNSELVQYSVCETCLSNSYLCHFYNYSTGELECLHLFDLLILFTYLFTCLEMFYTLQCDYSQPADVILSQWSDWSKCRDNYSSRSRDLIGYPSSVIPDSIPLRLTQQRHCDFVTHSWRVSDWSECVSNSIALCSHGYQNRSVECLDSNGLASNFCEVLDKPLGNRTCQQECCEYSEWSVFSECSADCGTGIKSRKRIVLSSNCDQSIGAIRTSEEECYLTQCLPSYRWRVKEFGDCIPLTEHGNCGVGYRTAGIECVSESGAEVTGDNCATSPLPPSEDLVSPCPLPCPLCYLTQWGPFSPCSQSCGSSVRTRNRELIGPNCSSLPVALSESAPCPITPCPSFRWAVVSRWSSCIPLDTSCGRGMRHRAVVCLRSDGVPFSDDFCPESPPPLLKECSLSCPQDCVADTWTQWTQCSATCDGGVKTRTRQLMSASQQGGRDCPPLLERVPCSSEPCPVPQWVSAPWSPCVSHSCGFGRRDRAVRCLVGSNLSDSCSLLDKPALEKRCYIPCPPDCIHSDWTQWSPCTHGTRDRSREVLRGRQGSGLSCGSTQESQSCTPPDLTWTYSQFSSCAHSDKLCGIGTQHRNYSCVTSRDVSTSSHLCLEHLGPPAVLSRPCNLSCPIKCSVSEFSHWSVCSADCSEPSGVQTRVRSVSSPPQNGGPVCPPLSQTRPCFRTSCPHPSVHRGQWSSCQTDGRSCGVGQSVRSVLCLDKFGSSLPLSACLSPGQDPYSQFVRLDTDTRTDTSCSIPCPDDVLSPQPLAGQSNCTSLCSNTSRGISISPRPLSHPLPGSNTYAGDRTPEYRVEDCVASPHTCLSLEWQTSDWLGGHREVSCVAKSSAGVIPVSSGCECGTKPSQTRLPCLPSCPLLSSCSDFSGRCVCNHGYLMIGKECVMTGSTPQSTTTTTTTPALTATDTQPGL